MALSLSSSPIVDFLDDGVTNWWTPGYNYSSFEFTWDNRRHAVAVRGMGDDVVRANWHLPKNWMVIPI